MSHRLDFRRYRLPFAHPVRTAHGPWSQREGIWLRVEAASGRTGFGEIAPIPWFGTETLDEAEEVLMQLGGTVDDAAAGRIDERCGCVRFALASALTEAAPATAAPPPGRAGPGRGLRWAVAALLPAGRPALAAADQASARGFVAFKWKVGVLAAEDEWVVLDDLLARLPPRATLRLDANGAWTTRQAAAWLERCAERPIEFVEQPCLGDPAAGETGAARAADTLLGLARDYPTKLALDESVTGWRSLRAWLERGWPGVLVVKPALAGPPEAVRDLLSGYRADAVFSSALETAIGRRAALRLACSYRGPVSRALGFGVAPLFRDPQFDGGSPVPFLTTDAVPKFNPGALWNAPN